MLNLVQVQASLQSPIVTNQDLMKYANGANPEVPSYMALGELNRRKQLEQLAQPVPAQQPTVKNQIEQGLGSLGQVNPLTAQQGANPLAPQAATNPTAPQQGTNPVAAPTGQVNPVAAPAGQVNPVGAIQQSPEEAYARMKQVQGPQGVPQAPQAPAVPMAHGGLASMPLHHMFHADNYAGGGIVAFDEGGKAEETVEDFPASENPTAYMSGREREAYEANQKLADLLQLNGSVAGVQGAPGSPSGPTVISPNAPPSTIGYSTPVETAGIPSAAGSQGGAGEEATAEETAGPTNYSSLDTLAGIQGLPGTPSGPAVEAPEQAGPTNYSSLDTQAGIAGLPGTPSGPAIKAPDETPALPYSSLDTLAGQAGAPGGPSGITDAQALAAIKKVTADNATAENPRFTPLGTSTATAPAAGIKGAEGAQSGEAKASPATQAATATKKLVDMFGEVQPDAVPDDLPKSLQEMKDYFKKAGVKENPLSALEDRQRAMEARQAENHKQDAMERLIAFATAYSGANPALGFAGAASAGMKARTELVHKQREIQDAEDKAAMEFWKADAMAQDARARDDAKMGIEWNNQKKQALKDFKTSYLAQQEVQAKIKDSQSKEITALAAKEEVALKTTESPRKLAVVESNAKAKMIEANAALERERGANADRKEALKQQQEIKKREDLTNALKNSESLKKASDAEVAFLNNPLTGAADLSKPEVYEQYKRLHQAVENEARAIHTRQGAGELYQPRPLLEKPPVNPKTPSWWERTFGPSAPANTAAENKPATPYTPPRPTNVPQGAQWSDKTQSWWNTQTGQEYK